MTNAIRVKGTSHARAAALVILGGLLTLVLWLAMRDEIYTPSPATEALVARWVADSTRIDSIVRTMPVDRLEALYRDMLIAPDPVAVMHRIDCFSDSLAARYGTAAWLEALQLANRRTQNRRLEREMERRLPRNFVYGPAGCVVSRTAPRTIGGTDLSVPLGKRPIPPR